MRSVLTLEVFSIVVSFPDFFFSWLGELAHSLACRSNQTLDLLLVAQQLFLRVFFVLDVLTLFQIKVSSLGILRTEMLSNPIDCLSL